MPEQPLRASWQSSPSVCGQNVDATRSDSVESGISAMRTPAPLSNPWRSPRWGCGPLSRLGSCGSYTFCVLSAIRRTPMEG